VSLVIIAARWHLAIIEGAVVLLALQATWSTATPASITPGGSAGTRRV